MGVAERFWSNPTANRFYGRDKKSNIKKELTWHELRAKAKSMNIAGYTKMKRPELEKAVSDASE